MEQGSEIYVAGGSTFIGTALLRRLTLRGYTNIVGLPGEEPHLRDAGEVDAFFAKAAPEVVFLAGGNSGSIGANLCYPADLMRDNLLVECHVIHSAYRHRVKKLLYLASSCVYLKEGVCAAHESVESLLTGPLESTSESYALAKLVGIKMGQAYYKQ